MKTCIRKELSAKERWGAALCYIGGLFTYLIVPLIMIQETSKQEKPFLYYHAKRAAVIQAVVVAIIIPLGVFTNIAEANEVFELGETLRRRGLKVLHAAAWAVSAFGAVQAVLGKPAGILKETQQ